MKRLITVMAAATLALLGPGAAAGAAAPPGDPEGEGWQDGRNVGVTLRNSQIVLTGDVAGGSADGYRLPQACWYEPGPDAQSMLDTQQSVRDYWFRANPDGTEEEFQEFLKQFEERVGEGGRWWVPAYNEKDPDGLACWGDLDPFVWVPPGATPPAGITIDQLRDIARAALTVPEPTVELSPDARSYVNLSTWVWLTGVEDPTRSVTATLPGIMSATVTATQDAIAIDPGTDDETAATVKASGCGETGTPYTAGADENFDCGVTYHRASVNEEGGVYELTVTSLWAVSAEPVPFAYDPIEVEVTRDVPVSEAQTTVRRSGGS